MNKNNLNNNIPEGFIESTSLPRSEKEANLWQKANYDWWQNYPMRYDWKESIKFPEFTKEFYLEIDKRFFANASEYLDKNKKFPFEEFIDFNSLKNKNVLEIGVGNGSHAHLLAQYSKTFTGIDITDYAVKSTKKRMEIFNLNNAQIIKMDAERLDFPNNNFDFIWSWGVIHHSSNTELILSEINRVLKRNGKAVIMVYYRGWWNYFFTGFLRGLIFGDFFKGLTLSDSVQKYTDGAIARYYSKSDLNKMTKGLFKIAKIEVSGPKSDVIPLPGGRLKELLKNVLSLNISRFLTQNLRMGGFLIFQLFKI